MICVTAWLEEFTRSVKDTFGERVRFIGLQGSYCRGEATESSDIDTVVILDALSASDIRKYDLMLDKLPHRELTCGFISGENQLLSWEPSDLFQFYYDTKPVYGTLDCILPLIDRDAVQRAVKIGACNIYHGCVHNMLYEKSEEVLRALYKSAAFTARAIVFLQTGNYFAHLKDLYQAASVSERVIIDNLTCIKRGERVDLAKMSEELFEWAGRLIED